MKTRNIAVLFGGRSPEYSVSLESAYSILQSLSHSSYHPIPIGITTEGEWFYYTGDLEKIREDRWQTAENCKSAMFSPNYGAKRLIVFQENRVEELAVDAAFPVMHGRFGEDGTIQGLLELSGIPLVGCGTLASALCMDKERAHKLAETAGITVPKACQLEGAHQLGRAMQFASNIGFPVFVKPVRAGSSYGITKVGKKEELAAAIQTALQYDQAVIIEEAIEGFEVGCAVMGKDSLIVGEVDEIQLSGGFFDYTEKYTLKTSEIHVPARMSPEMTNRVKETATRLYRTLGCAGFARVDLFVTPQDQIVFNEINTIPGFTVHSRFPGMMKAAGLSFDETVDKAIRLALEL